MYNDNIYYYESQRAKNLYLKAMQYSKNEESKALCLRMAGRCERQKLIIKAEDCLPDLEKYTPKNQYYQQIKQDYPQFYEKIMFQCTSFGEFYQKLE